MGVSEIGSRIAELLTPFDVTGLGVKRDPSIPKGVAAVYGPDDRHKVLGRADYVALACPLTNETRGMIDTEEFESINSDAVLVNVA